MGKNGEISPAISGKYLDARAKMKILEVFRFVLPNWPNQILQNPISPKKNDNPSANQKTRSTTLIQKKKTDGE